MKKKIFLGLLLGALSFSSCVKDNESDAVKKQRDAQAELLLAQAKVKNSEADLKTAEAKIKDAQAKLEEALIQSKVDAATASATIVVANAAKEVEDKKLQKEKVLAKFEAELAKAKAEAENIQAEAAALKVKNLSNLVAGVGSATTEYSTAVDAVTNKEDEINKLSLEIVKLKAGVISATEYVKREKAQKEADLEAKKLELKAYEDMVKSNFGTISEIKAKLSKKKNEADVAKVAYVNEYDKVEASVADGTSYGKAFEKLSGEELAKLEFFKNLKKVYDLAETAAKGATGKGFLNDSDAENFAKKIVKNTSKLTTSDKDILVENDGAGRNFVKNSSANKTYQLYKVKYSTNAELQAGFFSDTHVEAAKGYFDLKTKDAEATQKAKEKIVTQKQSDYATAVNSATNNVTPTLAEGLRIKVQEAKKALADAKAEKQKADEKVTEAENDKKAFEDAIEEVKKEANQKEVLDVATKFIEEQKTLSGKLDKLKELDDKHTKLDEEKTALDDTVENVAKVIDSGKTNADEIAGVIKEAKEKISQYEEEIASLDRDKKQENLVKKEEAKLERYKKELDLLNKKLDAARTAYEAAIEALKKANA